MCHSDSTEANESVALHSHISERQI